MNVINQSNRNIMLLLGENPFFRNKKYRLNKYCLIHDIEECKLIFNEMTRSMISITNKELERIYEFDKVYLDEDLEYVEYMIENYFLVQEDYDETTVTDWLRTKYRPIIDDKYLKEVYDFILFPTTTCNARCFYCYEKPMSKKPMKMEMAETVVKYIMKKCKNKNRTVSLRWFGGEPLFNIKIIRYICKTLRDNNYKISSSMISNGYLFNDEIVNEAVKEWNLNSVQITLDGTENIYNKAKNYIYKNQDEVSPFKKVIYNIDKLINNDVHVSIRMNADVYNCDDLKKLVRFLNEKFNGNNNLSCYIYPIFEDKENPRTNEEKQELFEKIWEVEEVMKECNFLNGSTEVNDNIRATHCMVDNGRTINIHPDGTLGLCEHYIDSDIWGHIDENGDEIIDNLDVIYEWRDYLNDGLCKTCPIYPDCIRTRKCNDLCSCDSYMQEFRIRHDKINMEAVFRKWLNNNKCNNNSCSITNSGFECASNENDGTCYCVSQRCEDKENWCYSVDKERGVNNSNSDGCYCVSQRCEDKENWCYCISQKQEVENHKCNGGSCTCKKEEEKQEEQKVKKSLWEKIKDIFD